MRNKLAVFVVCVLFILILTGCNGTAFLYPVAEQVTEENRIPDITGEWTFIPSGDKEQKKYRLSIAFQEKMYCIASSEGDFSAVSARIRDDFYISVGIDKKRLENVRKLIKKYEQLLLLPVFWNFKLKARGDCWEIYMLGLKKKEQTPGKIFETETEDVCTVPGEEYTELLRNGAEKYFEFVRFGILEPVKR